MVKRSQKLRWAHGAVFVEFAMVSLIFFAMIGFIVYWSLYLFRYQALSDAISSTLRTTTVTPGTADVSQLLCSSSANGGATTICSQTVQYIHDIYGFNVSTEVSYPSGVTVCNDTTSNTFKIVGTANWTTPCVGFCFWSFLTKTASVQVNGPIEDPCMTNAIVNCTYSYCSSNCDPAVHPNCTHIIPNC